jgi:hypothetical protein
VIVPVSLIFLSVPARSSACADGAAAVKVANATAVIALAANNRLNFMAVVLQLLKKQFSTEVPTALNH